MSYFKTLGWTLLTIVIIFGVISGIGYLVRWGNKVFESLEFNSDTILGFLHSVLGSDMLVGAFLAVLAISPLIAFAQWLSE